MKTLGLRYWAIGNQRVGPQGTRQGDWGQEPAQGGPMRKWRLRDICWVSNMRLTYTMIWGCPVYQVHNVILQMRWNLGIWIAFLPLHSLWVTQPHPSPAPTSKAMSVNSTFGHLSLAKCKYLKPILNSFLGHRVSPSDYPPATADFIHAGSPYIQAD